MFGDFMSIVVLLLFASAVAYRSQFLQKKKLFHFSLLQILYLVVVPGMLFIILNSYVQEVLHQPLQPAPMFSDRFLTNWFQLSIFFGIVGLIMHAVTKMLAMAGLRYSESEAAQLNRYYHLNLSHNLLYASGFMLLASISLLEMNHVPVTSVNSLLPPVWKGLVLGIIVVVGLVIYTRSEDEYKGRWADLKATFIVFWVACVLVLYGAARSDFPLKEYQLAYPSLLSFLFVVIVNLFLLVRRVKLKRDQRKQDDYPN